MRKVLWAFAGLIAVVLGALGAVLAFDVPVRPPPLASISEPFAGVDFSEGLATDGDVGMNPQERLTLLGTRIRRVISGKMNFCESWASCSRSLTA